MNILKECLVVKVLGNKIEYKEWIDNIEKKTLTTSSNSAVEFQDLVDYAVVNAFNSSTNFYNMIRRVPQKGRVITWTARTGRNSTAGSSSELGNSTSSYVERDMFTLPIKINEVVVEVSDFAEVAHISEGADAIGLASLFEQELNDATVDLLSKPYTSSSTKMGINAQLMRDGTGNYGLDMNGLKYWIDDSSSTLSSITTVAGKTRSSYENLYVASDSFDNTSAALAESDLRAVLDSVEEQGANRDTLAIVTTYALRSKLLDLVGAKQRYLTTDVNFGFNVRKVPTYDGVPIVADKDVESGKMYVLDMNTVELRVLKEPHFVPLAKTTSSIKGKIRFYANMIVKDVGKCGVLANKS